MFLLQAEKAGKEFPGSMVSLETVNRVLQYAQGQAEFTSTAGLKAKPLEKLLGQGRLTARSIRISTVGIHSAVTEHGGVPPASRGVIGPRVGDVFHSAVYGIQDAQFA